MLNPHYRHTAHDFGYFTVTEQRNPIAYGARGKFHYTVLGPGTYQCLPSTFGILDPLPNVRKACQVLMERYLSEQNQWFNVGGGCEFYKGITSGLNGNVLYLDDLRIREGWCTTGTFGGNPDMTGSALSCYGHTTGVD